MKFLAVLVCFVLSGFAALVYETAWMRQFSIVFGTSELAVATVLASYMAGLALGSAIAARFVDRIKRPVWVYGLLELGIALSAVAVPLALRLAIGLRASFLGGQPVPPDGSGLGSSLFYLLCAFVILMVPTGFMGATLPLLARHVVHSEEQIGRRVGLLYALNTAGAVLGTIAAAFLILPAFGLFGTILVGVGVNVLVFFLALGIARSSEDPGATDFRGSDDAPSDRSPWAPLVLPIMLVSGMVSFTYEVMWTRLLGHLTGASIYAFATMLASFLAGITLGSLIAAPLAKRRDAAARGLSLAQYGVALTSILIYLALDRIPDFALRLETQVSSDLMRHAILGALILFPATICIGATFPFTVRLLAGSAEDAAPASAKVYAFNTVGAILGATLAGFVLLPALDYRGTARLAVATSLVLGLLSLLLLQKNRGKALGGGVVLTLLGLTLFQPQRPDRMLRSSLFTGLEGTGPAVYYNVGRSATVLMLEQEGSYVVRSNGLPEADIPLKGAVPGNWTTRWLAALPVLARPQAEDMLVIGFGGGVTVESIPQSVSSIDVIELEHNIIEASQEIAEFRLSDPLGDPRVNVVINDARGALSLTNKRYDAIVSQPSHPWSPGAANLFTREFMGMAKEHLEEDGVFLQWMNVNFVDAELFASLGATLMDVFPHVRVYRPDPLLILFLGSRSPLDIEAELARTGEPLASFPEYFAGLGVFSTVDVLTALCADKTGLEKLCAGAPLNTDNRNLLATESPKILRSPLGVLGADRYLRSVDPLLAPDSTAFATVSSETPRALATLRLSQNRSSDRAAALAAAIPDPGERNLALALLYRAGGNEAEAQKLLGEIEAPLDVSPMVSFAKLQPRLTEMAGDPATRDELLVLAQGLSDSAAAVVRGTDLRNREKWEALRELEGALARTRPEEPWYAQALELRASWRTYLRSESPRALGEEAVLMCDRLLAIEPFQQHLLLRAEAAKRADQPHALLESVREWSKGTAQVLASGQTDLRAFVAQTARALTRKIGPLTVDERVQEQRVQEVLDQLQALAM